MPLSFVGPLTGGFSESTSSSGLAPLVSDSASATTGSAVGVWNSVRARNSPNLLVDSAFGAFLFCAHSKSAVTL